MTTSETAHRPSGATAPAPSAEGAVLRADDLIAGYLPGVNILNGCRPRTASEGELVGIIGPNGAGKSTLLKALFGLVKIHDRDGRARRARTSPTSAPTSWSPRASASCRRPTTCSRSLTIQENLEMGVLPAAQGLRRAFRLRLRPVPGARRPAQPARRLAVRRRAPDGRHGTGADDGARRCCCSTSPPPACPPSCRTRSSCRPAGSTGPASRSSWSSRTPRRCLQICDRGYVLDQGRNAYTGTGERAGQRPQGHRALPRHPRPAARRLIARRAGRAQDNATEPRPIGRGSVVGASDEPGHGRTPETESTWAVGVVGGVLLDADGGLQSTDPTALRSPGRTDPRSRCPRRPVTRSRHSL